MTDIAIAFSAGMLTASLLAVAILKLAFSPVLIAVRDAIEELRAAASLMQARQTPWHPDNRGVPPDEAWQPHKSVGKPHPGDALYNELIEAEKRGDL